jgi:hypothetical protein
MTISSLRCHPLVLYLTYLKGKNRLIISPSLKHTQPTLDESRCLPPLDNPPQLSPELEVLLIWCQKNAFHLLKFG